MKVQHYFIIKIVLSMFQTKSLHSRTEEALCTSGGGGRSVHRTALNWCTGVSLEQCRRDVFNSLII